jgi:hypothetical protein
MLKNLTRLRRLVLIAFASVCLITALAFQRVSASDFTCTNIDVDGVFTGNIFCTSSTSSAGFYYFYYNIYTQEYTMGPNR